MHMSRIILYSVAILIFTAACKYSDKPKTYEIREKLKIEYPPYLSRTTDIHPSGAFQVQNKYRDVYYIIVRHPYLPDSGYVQHLYDSLTNDLKNGVAEPLVLADSSFTNSKGYAVKELVMSGKLKDKILIFDFQLIQKDTVIYQTSGWMFKAKKDMWFNDLRKINESLTILE
jgi:hypothetical protein